MPVRLGAMLKIIPSSSPSPRGRRDRLSLSLSRGRDGRKTPVTAGKRDGVRVIGFLKLLLVFLAATAAAEISLDSEYDYDPSAPGRYSLPVVKSVTDVALLNSN